MGRAATNCFENILNVTKINILNFLNQKQNVNEPFKK
jgi:hypothetical protein